LAGLDRDVEAWSALRAVALHGFIECSDGRLYHPFLCEQARVAWDARVVARDRKRQWRETKAKKERGPDGPVPGTGRVKERGPDGPVPSEAKRRDVADLKVSDVASLRDAPAALSQGTTGQAAVPPIPPSLGKTVHVEGGKATAKQPLSSKAGLRSDGMPQWLSTPGGVEAMGLSLGIGSFREETEPAGEAKSPWGRYTFRVMTAAGLVTPGGRKPA